jgi:hypothetical protein
MHYTIDSWRKKREREHLIDPCTDIFQEKKTKHPCICIDMI